MHLFIVIKAILQIFKICSVVFFCVWSWCGDQIWDVCPHFTFTSIKWSQAGFVSELRCNPHPVATGLSSQHNHIKTRWSTGKPPGSEVIRQWNSLLGHRDCVRVCSLEGSLRRLSPLCSFPACSASLKACGSPGPLWVYVKARFSLKIPLISVRLPARWRSWREAGLWRENRPGYRRWMWEDGLMRWMCGQERWIEEVKTNGVMWKRTNRLDFKVETGWLKEW